MGAHYDAVEGAWKRPAVQAQPEPQSESAAEIMKRLRRDQGRAMASLEDKERELVERERIVGEREEAASRREAALGTVYELLGDLGVRAKALREATREARGG